MNNFAISNLEHCLGSDKKHILNFGKIFSNMKELRLKTGIDFINKSKKDEDVLTLSLRSCKKTLKKFKGRIDCLVVVTQTAKNRLPPVSYILQGKLRLNKDIICYDLNMGCSGFVYALSLIQSQIKNGLIKNALLVCSDTYTKFFRANDRNCISLFSDAASSCIIKKKISSFKPTFSFLSQGSGYNSLIEKNNVIFMNGPEVFFFTTNSVPELFYKLLKKSNCRLKNIDHFVFHQASKLVLDKLKSKLKIPKEKFHTNYKSIGNTTSSTIPILLETLNKKKILKKNDTVMLLGFGVGLSIAGCVIKWN
jgi:3-oxoacyl-[acyl-carrier-protein] synthase-3